MVPAGSWMVAVEPNVTALDNSTVPLNTFEPVHVLEAYFIGTPLSTSRNTFVPSFTNTNVSPAMVGWFTPPFSTNDELCVRVRAESNVNHTKGWVPWMAVMGVVPVT